MSILTGILAYFLITTPVAVAIGDALQRNRRSMTARIPHPRGHSSQGS